MISPFDNCQIARRVACVQLANRDEHAGQGTPKSSSTNAPSRPRTFEASLCTCLSASRVTRSGPQVREFSTGDHLFSTQMNGTINGCRAWPVL